METLSELKPTNHDIIWIATARLHQRNKATREIFTVQEIADEANSLGFNVSMQTLKQYISSHCVANIDVSPDDHCYLFRIDTGRYRLRRPGDHIRKSRRYGKKIPEEEAIPKEYRDLLKWYADDYCLKSTEPQEIKPHLDTPPYVRIDDNGKITIPYAIKDWLDLRNGDYVSFVKIPNGRIQLQKVRVTLQLQ